MPILVFLCSIYFGEISMFDAKYSKKFKKKIKKCWSDNYYHYLPGSDWPIDAWHPEGNVSVPFFKWAMSEWDSEWVRERVSEWGKGVTYRDPMYVSKSQQIEYKNLAEETETRTGVILGYRRYWRCNFLLNQWESN